MINIKNLSFKYNKNIVFNNLNIEIKFNEITSIIGNNGTGKTSLFNIIKGLEKNYTGDVKISGDNHLYIGYLQSEIYYYPKMTGREYLEFIMIAQNQWDDDFEIINEILKLPLDEFIETYSLGMVKKIGIYGLLLQKNDIILLDEPYNGLDFESVINLNEVLKLLKKLEKTVLIASHNLMLIFEISDSILLLENSEIIVFYPENYDELKSKLVSDENMYQLEKVLKNIKRGIRKP